MRRLVALILALVLWPALAGAQTIVHGVSPKGIRFALAPRPANPLVTLSFAWRDGFGEARAGSEGLSSLAAPWHAAGPAGMTEAEFREELRDESIGLSLGATGGHTLGSLIAPPDRLHTAVDRMRAVLIEPALGDATLRRFKRQRRLSIAQGRETPATAARTLALSMVAGNTPYLLEHIAPARSPVADVERTDVEAWRKAVLARDNLVVAAAGPIAEPDLIRIIDRIFGDLPQRAAVPPKPDITLQRDTRTLVIERPVAQTTIVLAGGTSLDPADSDMGNRASLANSVLSGGPASRLFRSIREELGATYGSSSQLVPLGNEAVAFLISSAVDHALAGKALATLREGYERFHRDGVTEAEIAPLRARSVTGIEEGLTRSEVAWRLRGVMMRGRNPDEVTTLAQRVAAVTAEEVNAVINERLPPPPLATVIVAPSAEGFGADCVVRRDQPIEACLEP
jgi:zinc protease